MHSCAEMFEAQYQITAPYQNHAGVMRNVQLGASIAKYLLQEGIYGEETLLVRLLFERRLLQSLKSFDESSIG